MVEQFRIAKEKENKLKEIIKGYESMAVAFSAGVDSTYLLKIGKEVLGDKAVAITVNSTVFPQSECDESISFCEEENIKHIILGFDELSVEGYAKNSKDRCYICKKSLFNYIKEAAANEGISTIAEGSNVDDLGDYRPGLKAIAELGIKSPLKEAGLRKNEIRLLSKEYNLKTWNKPSFACLSSRIPYGEKITIEKIRMVEEAEKFLTKLGFIQKRVRIHGKMARIEITKDAFAEIMRDEIRDDIAKEFKKIGFSYVTLDLMGYRTGSLNEVL